MYKLPGNYTNSVKIYCCYNILKNYFARVWGSKNGVMKLDVAYVLCVPWRNIFSLYMPHAFINLQIKKSLCPLSSLILWYATHFHAPMLSNIKDVQFETVVFIRVRTENA